MATPLTYSHRPLSFAVPAVKGTAILPQTVALGVTVKVVRPNEKYFGIHAEGFLPESVAGRLGSVWWDEANGRWAVERWENGETRVIARYRQEHLRQAVATAIIDVACEYVIDRDELNN